MSGLLNLDWYKRQRPLYSGEESYFKDNPNTAGMATEDNYIILNPYSPLSKEQLNNVKVNEASRLFMNNFGVPNVSLTNEQQQNLAGTSYKDVDEENRKATILARILSGDKSGGIATMEQMEAIKPMLFLRGLLE
jgi:hypothetical protein